MNPEEKIIEVMKNVRKMKRGDRDLFFQMLASASIAYMRGSMDKKVFDGFMHAALNDDTVLNIKDQE